VKFWNLDSPEAVGQYGMRSVYVRSQTVQPCPRSYYHHQLLGFTVMDDAGHALGALDEILQTGQTTCSGARDWRPRDLLPAIAGVLLKIDPTARSIWSTYRRIDTQASDAESHRRSKTPSSPCKIGATGWVSIFQGHGAVRLRALISHFGSAELPGGAAEDLRDAG